VQVFLTQATDVQRLVQGVFRGEKRAIARTISMIENNEPEAQKIISLIYQKTGKAHIIGITGPPGAGKSTLVEKLAKELRNRKKTIGIVAVDPTSPFTGGAFLGDRVRMQDLSTDEGVYIRSMATRNNLGGLARATKDAAHVLDAAGKDVIIVETVGAGQSEVEVVKVAQTVVVVLAPGLGDDIQAIKAGQMEIGDIFVVNKGDRENANKAVTDIKAALELSTEERSWKPLVLKASALTGEGIGEFVESIEKHRAYLKKGALDIQHKANAEIELIEALKQKITQTLIQDLREKGEWVKATERISAREIDPYSAADSLLKLKAKNLKT
jgi:LAO/AO transport system kinase